LRYSIGFDNISGEKGIDLIISTKITETIEIERVHSNVAE